MRGYLLFVTLLFFGTMQGQNQLIDSTKNTILNKENLSDFYTKLAETKAGKHNLEILHIGDSHIQAGFFTETLREVFQHDYGNAGRGLVFPYRLANTNGHMDARFSSDVQWKRYRIITEDAPRVGISGATIYTKASEFSLQLHCKDKNAFNQIEVYGEGLQQVKLAIAKEAGKKIQPKIIRKIHVVKSGDVLGKIARKYGVSIRQIRQWNRLKSTMIRVGQKLVIQVRHKVPTYTEEDFKWVTAYEQTDSTLKAVLDDSVTEIYLIKKKQQENNTVSLYSLHLRNSQQGIIYNGIGYNGAKYTDYLRSQRFFTQLGQLFRPDLIIVSLGTNEAFDKVYSLAHFRDDVVRFCKELELRTGCKNILLTTPPSALRKRRYPNKKLSDYSKILKEVAQECNYAVWDLYEIMQGENGMKTWYKAGLAGKDRIHFTESGYKLQGELLYKAFMKKEE